MKRILLSVAMFALATTATFAQKKISDVAKFDKETIDFGRIKQGVPQKGTFTVTNISNEPLIIEQANPTCGCTISDYTKEPIAPGKTGVINATYNAAAMNHFDKHLTVKFAGIDEVKSITFTGDVVAAEEFDKANGGKVAAAPATAPAVISEKAPAPASLTKAPAANSPKTAVKAAKAPVKKAVKH